MIKTEREIYEKQLAFQKTVDTIKSCTNKIQLETAKKLVHQPSIRFELSSNEQLTLMNHTNDKERSL